MKTVVTHFTPDTDAICAVWLVKKFMPGFAEAKIVFVPAGKTLDDQKPDSNPDIIHVDTGCGRFDHHQNNENTCAARKVFLHLKKNRLLKEKETKALFRMVKVVNEIDHFRQVNWPESTDDRYDFFLDKIIDGLRLFYGGESAKIMEVGLVIFEAVFSQFKNKIWADEIIENQGRKFNSPWGKALGILTTNDEVLDLAQRKGYRLVIRKDPRKNYIRIKALPDRAINLTKLYNILREKDSEATWFLHASRQMILNGSTKNPQMKPTKLTLEELIKIIKGIKKSGLK